jgi:NADP-dependent 3-hydroxy acid dehydrogenase YdfG
MLKVISSCRCITTARHTGFSRLWSFKMDKWKGKIACVTGASVGIGEAIVKDLAKNGIIVIGLARRPEKIEEFAKEVKDGQIFAYKCDVSDLESVKSAFKWIEEKFGCLHILINNAGIG